MVKFYDTVNTFLSLKLMQQRIWLFYYEDFTVLNIL